MLGDRHQQGCQKRTVLATMSEGVACGVTVSTFLYPVVLARVISTDLPLIKRRQFVSMAAPLPSRSKLPSLWAWLPMSRALSNGEYRAPQPQQSTTGSGTPGYQQPLSSDADPVPSRPCRGTSRSTVDRSDRRSRPGSSRGPSPSHNPSPPGADSRSRSASPFPLQDENEMRYPCVPGLGNAGKSTNPKGSYFSVSLQTICRDAVSRPLVDSFLPR